ncbi:hypothetical protein BAUCODRAFT_60134, partial [Baudoinia panamericana UAMH 10762]
KMASRSFTHQPLNEAQKEFRMIRLLPCCGNDSPIEAEMKAFWIDDAREFTALSYCWTIAEATCEISVGGEPFLVRPSLHAFLQIWLAEKRQGWLFVDAICINQNDVAERSSQVALMGQIYRNAYQVLAWLG